MHNCIFFRTFAPQIEIKLYNRTMQYTVIHLAYNFTEDWQQPIFEQELADMGVEVFDQSDAYIQTNILAECKQQIEEFINQYPDVTLLDYEECPDQNWNAQWEAEHQPILLPLGVRITPHCAFGAGHHETTSMMVNAIIEAQQQQRFHHDTHVLDMGCGTGILAIMAKKCGAGHVLAVDIDDKSIANTIENASDNATQIDTLLADTPPQGQYDFILANIHRNILIAHMPYYAQYLKNSGELWMSGFYEQDISYIVQEAQAYGLQHTNTYAQGEWRMITLTHQQQ